MWDKFKYWFINVFWYHYKKMVLIGLSAILVLVFLIYSTLTQSKADLNYLFISRLPSSDEVMNPLTDMLKESVGDINEDGKLEYHCTVINPENGQTDIVELQVFILDESSRLYIVGESAFDTMADIMTADFGEDLSAHGFTTVPEKSYLVDLSEAPLLESLGLNDELMYAIICRLSPDESKDENIQQAQKAAIECLRSILEWQP